jgi:aryl-alcohol dehydrogenase-like predicted oxidoreductase
MTGFGQIGLGRVGLGTWAIGGPGWRGGWGAQSDADSLATIHAALDRGVDWLDTAPLYGRGHAETLIGHALADRPRRGRDVRIASKCGWPWVGRRARPFARLTAASVRGELEQSLRRLRAERVDLYQVHHPRPPEQLAEGWEELARLRERGLVGACGVCNAGVADLERLRAIAPVESLQIPYNLLHRDAEDEVLPYCRRHGIPVLAASPLHSGMLADGFDRARVSRLPGDDWRRGHRDFTEPRLTACLRAVERLRAAAGGRPLARLALGWLLAQPGVHAAILGARHPRQVAEALTPWPELDVAAAARLGTAAASPVAGLVK